MLDPSQFFPTFLTLLRIPDPRSWLASILPSTIADALRISFLSNTSHTRIFSVAGPAARRSIALGPDRDDHLDNKARSKDDNTSILKNSDYGGSEPANLPHPERSTLPLESPKMTQLYFDSEEETGKAGNSTNSNQPDRANSGSSSNSHDTLHPEGGDGSKTPTQRKTDGQAERPELELNAAEFGSLTAEQIAQLQANMLEDMHDADARPLISIIQPMEVLMDEYSSNPNFLKKMEWLKKEGWLGVRRTKGDGDCFYRSFAFAWVERILRAQDRELAVAAAISTLHTTWLSLTDVGFDTEILVDFYDVLRSLVEQIITPEPGGKALNASLLLEAFTNAEASNSIVSYVRMLTSAELRKNQDEYAAFVVHPDTQESLPVPEFCNQFVDGMGREADHVQMQALAKAMGVNLSVAYLDGRLGNEDAAVDFVKFENGGGNEANGIEDIMLLYRPGHYDILEHRAHEHRGSTASALVSPSTME